MLLNPREREERGNVKYPLCSTISFPIFNLQVSGERKSRLFSSSKTDKKDKADKNAEGSFALKQQKIVSSSQSSAALAAAAAAAAASDAGADGSNLNYPAISLAGNSNYANSERVPGLGIGGGNPSSIALAALSGNSGSGNAGSISGGARSGVERTASGGGTQQDSSSVSLPLFCINSITRQFGLNF